MISLSTNIWSGPNNGITSASTRRVMSPGVRDNLINPKISSDEPLAALSDIHDGGTVSIGALHGWVLFHNNSETHAKPLAESTVKSLKQQDNQLSRGYESAETKKRKKQVFFFETAKS